MTGVVFQADEPLGRMIPALDDLVHCAVLEPFDLRCGPGLGGVTIQGALNPVFADTGQVGHEVPHSPGGTRRNGVSGSDVHTRGINRSRTAMYASPSITRASLTTSL